MLAVCFTLLTGAARAEVDLDKAKADLEKLCKVFPELFWHATDACLRETTTLGGHMDKKADFVPHHKAVVEKIAKLGKGEKSIVMARIKLFRPDDPDEHWLLDLKTTGQRWTAEAAIKRMPSGTTFDLFDGDIFMGSMKPYLEQGLKAYAEGKDFEQAFPRKEKEKKEKSPAPKK
jgi:hypothetical protein